MYIRHNPLFSFDTLMQYQPKTRLAMVFESIDLAMRLCSIPTVTSLVERLKTDLLFRYDCGFSTAQPVPSLATFSRFFQKITNTEGLQELFSALVALLAGTIAVNRQFKRQQKAA